MNEQITLKMARNAVSVAAFRGDDQDRYKKEDFIKLAIANMKEAMSSARQESKGQQPLT